jgi:hypothetical protein
MRWENSNTLATAGPKIGSRGWMNMVVRNGYEDAHKKVGIALREAHDARTDESTG